MPELTLNHDQRHAFVRHFDGVGVAKLMRGEAAPDARSRGGALELLLGGGRFPMSSGRRPVNDAQQCADR